MLRIIFCEWPSAQTRKASVRQSIMKCSRWFGILCEYNRDSPHPKCQVLTEIQRQHRSYVKCSRLCPISSISTEHKYHKSPAPPSEGCYNHRGHPEWYWWAASSRRIVARLLGKVLAREQRKREPWLARHHYALRCLHSPWIRFGRYPNLEVACWGVKVSMIGYISCESICHDHFMSPRGTRTGTRGAW